MQKTKDEMNLMILRFKSVMFEFKGQKVYLLRNHHRYLNAETAPRLLIGPYTPPFPKNARNSFAGKGAKILYTYDKIK
jgi:hypothetical protein